MTVKRDGAARISAGWLKPAVLLLAVAAAGLPLNDIYIYALLAIVAVVAFTGEVRCAAPAWLAALAMVALAIAGQYLLAPPRIDEGHNVFLPGGPGVLERELPADVYRHLAQEFDKQYPEAKRCADTVPGCWIAGGYPDRAYAFSADGIFHKSGMSRAVSEIDFSDPVWLRLGFVNDSKYNWSVGSDVQRASRDRRVWMELHRWHLTMPWFEAIRLPAAYVGGQLCWRGDVMWEGASGRFSLWRGDGCRAIEPANAGRRVFGIAIKPDSLAMRLEPPLNVRLMQFAHPVLALLAAIGVLLALVRIKPRRTILPFILIALAVAVIAIDDGSFLGGVRPFDSGGDGLFDDGLARAMLQKLLTGDITGFLTGGENVFCCGGPGLRYFRAFEHILFGESYLGYLSLVLLLPFAAYALFRRFLPGTWAIALVIGFVAIPAGELFGTTFIDYAKWAARGFADPAACILFLTGLWVLIGARPAPDERFTPALIGALLLALAIAMKPMVSPAAAIFLGGSGLATLYFRQWARLAGLCIGFLPVFSMALHNWVFGHVFVLFSSNSQGANLPVHRAFFQMVNWLSGPAESAWTIPLNAAGVVILIYVVTRGRRFDPWLRLVGAAALAQHAVAFFYQSGAARDHLLTWFLTMLVVMVFVREIGFDWLARSYPAISGRFVQHPLSRLMASGLAWLQKVSTKETT